MDDNTYSPDDEDLKIGVRSRTMLQAAIKQGNSRRDAFFSVHVGKGAVSIPFQLPVPSEFGKYHKYLMGNDIILEAPSGGQWKAIIRESWNCPKIGKGWKPFMIANGIREGHYLIFTLVGRMHFAVQFFDSSGQKKESLLLVDLTPASSPPSPPQRIYERSETDHFRPCYKPHKLEKLSTSSSPGQTSNGDDLIDDGIVARTEKYDIQIHPRMSGSRSRKLRNSDRVDIDSFEGSNGNEHPSCSHRVFERGQPEGASRWSSQNGGFLKSEAALSIHRKTMKKPWCEPRNNELPSSKLQCDVMKFKGAMNPTENELEDTIAKEGSKLGGMDKKFRKQATSRYREQTNIYRKACVIIDSDEEDDNKRLREVFKKLDYDNQTPETANSSDLGDLETKMELEGKGHPVDSSRRNLEQIFGVGPGASIAMMGDPEEKEDIPEDDEEVEDILKQIRCTELHEFKTVGAESLAINAQSSARGGSPNGMRVMVEMGNGTAMPEAKNGHGQKEMDIETPALHEKLDTGTLVSMLSRDNEAITVWRAQALLAATDIETPNEEANQERMDRAHVIQTKMENIVDISSESALSVTEKAGKPHIVAHDIKVTELETPIVDMKKVVENVLFMDGPEEITATTKTFERTSRKGPQCSGVPAMLPPTTKRMHQDIHKSAAAWADCSKKMAWKRNDGTGVGGYCLQGEVLSPAKRLLKHQGCQKFSKIVRVDLDRRHCVVTDEMRKRATKEGERCARRLENVNFMVILGDAQVYHDFYLEIPLEFLHVTGTPSESFKVKACLVDMDQKLWNVDWRWRAQSKRPQLSSDGWACFAIDHLLEEGDVCVFELLDTNPYFLLLVHIFKMLTNAANDTEIPVDHSKHTKQPPKENCIQEFRSDGTKKRPILNGHKSGLQKMPKKPRLQSWTKLFNTKGGSRSHFVGKRHAAGNSDSGNLRSSPSVVDTPQRLTDLQ